MSKSLSGGSDGLTLLLIVFIVLKLTHVIDWSWWWVLAPAWIPIAFFLAVYIIIWIIDKMIILTGKP